MPLLPSRRYQPLASCSSDQGCSAEASKSPILLRPQPPYKSLHRGLGLGADGERTGSLVRSQRCGVGGHNWNLSMLRVRKGALEGKTLPGRTCGTHQGLGRLFSVETPLGNEKPREDLLLGGIREVWTGCWHWENRIVTGCFLPVSPVCLPRVNDQTRNLATSAWHLA